MWPPGRQLPTPGLGLGCVSVRACARACTQCPGGFQWWDSERKQRPWSGLCVSWQRSDSIAQVTHETITLHGYQTVTVS